MAKSHKHAGGDDVDDTDDYDQGRNIILSLISQLRPGSDLSRITLPTFILERKSMLERITNQFQHPALLAQASAQQDPVLRFVDLLRWYMAGWHIAPKAVKKPLNPVLGEYFSCYWDLDDGSRAYYLAEQTSHHAPKSSFVYVYPEHRIRAEGVIIPKSKFLGNSAASIMEGVSIITLGNHERNGQPEQYELTQPNIYARNVLVGSLKLEMGDKAHVRCPQTGLECIVEFKVKGYISGTYHEVKGTVTQNGKALYELSGKWTEVLYLKDLKTGKKSVFFDSKKDVVVKPQVRPIDEQGKFESRRLWEKVCIALGKRDQKVATDEKFSIEDHQRLLQKRRSEGLEPPFRTRLFAPSKEIYQFRVFVHELLERANTQAEVERILSLVMPILPGEKFPPDFEEASEEKEKRVSETYRRSCEKSDPDAISDDPGSVSQFSRFEGDEFVDASDKLKN